MYSKYIHRKFFALILVVIFLSAPSTIKAQVPTGKDVFTITDDGTLRESTGAVLPTAVAKRFYQAKPDMYDFLAIYTNFPQPGAKHDWAAPVQKRHISGILPVADEQDDVVEQYGSAGKLKGVMVFHDIAPAGTEFFPLEYGVILHEMSHYWLAYAQGISRDQTIKLSQDGSHWSQLLDTATRENGKLYLSPIGGYPWKDLGSGVFANSINDAVTTGYWQRFNSFELYLMGLASKDEIQPMSIIKADGDRFYENNTEKIRGTAVTLSADDLISTLGPRVPAYPDTPKDFSVAYILVSAQGSPASEFAVKRFNYIIDNFPKAWHAATRQRSTINGIISAEPVQTPVKTPAQQPTATAPVNIQAPSPVPKPQNAPSVVNKPPVNTAPAKKELSYVNPVSKKTYTVNSSNAFKTLQKQASIVTQKSLDALKKETRTQTIKNLAIKHSGRFIMVAADKKRIWFVKPKSLKIFYLDNTPQSFDFFIANRNKD